MLHAALIPLSLCLLVSARLHHSRVPEDPFAFPKYRVSFLNGLPVSNETAQRWLHEGLRGGNLEFFGQPWSESPSPASIEGTDDGLSNVCTHVTSSPLFAQAARHRYTDHKLQKMKLSPKSDFLCLIPPPPQENPVVEEPASEVATPVHSWSLLQPLSGTCLYHRQGWFTYSYCHNSHVRQFHELHHQPIPTTGDYKPEEDPEWEAYTLGRAPPTLETGAELTTAEAAAAANLELARGAGSRYLVQRWGDGTYCDKTGRKREVEIQAGRLLLSACFHCSMTMTDTILFVKETQTCHYVLHIATPRLCGEPGFKSRIDAEEEHVIRCREIVSAAELERVDNTLPPAAYPFKRPKPQKKVIAPPPPAPEERKDKDGAKKGSADGALHSDVLRRALQQLLAQRQGAQVGDQHVFVEQLPDGETEFLIEFVDIDLPEGEGGADDIFSDDNLHDRLQDVLRAAGYDIRGGKPAPDTRTHEPDDDAEAQEDRAKKHRDEL
ncbi:glucosidase II beta subunit-like protein-domain-containing protein [Dichomitus squalens]|uniref:Protein OS-9 homolog n=1 Tax=Dichomitus squalens TaxID=114155 RepID=A0A4V2K296_9APHY|nr:glucosidase II beta subunit-like protein-domain-containing protein [Dichomitus squalens]